MICKNCGAEVKDGVKFCPSCGYKVVPPVQAAPEAGVCSDCGAKLKPGVKFCPSCGKKTSENGSDPQQSAPVPAPAPASTPAPAPVPEVKPEKTEPESKQEPAAVQEETAAAQDNSLICSCGTQLKPGAKFCPKCGSKVGEKAETKPAEEEKKPEPAAEEESVTCSCGNKLKPGAKFCPKCGNAVGNTSNQAAVSANSDTAPIPNIAPVNGAAVPAAAAVKKPLDKKVIAIIGAAAAVLIVIIIVIVIIANATPKLRLADYIKVEYNGYNGYGTINAEFDSDKFRNDWEGKLKYTGNSGEIGAVLDNYSNPTDLVLYNVKYTYSFDKSSELKNGDKIKLK